MKIEKIMDFDELKNCNRVKSPVVDTAPIVDTFIIKVIFLALFMVFW
jgi:hypothetical protein